MGLLGDIGNAASSAASAVGDAVEEGVETVADAGEDVVNAVVDAVQDGIEAGTDWLCKNGGEALCAVGNVVGGFYDGLLEGVQDVAGDLFDVVRDLGGIVGSILRLDVPGLLENLGNLAIHVLDLGIDVFRFLTFGYVVGGIVRKFERSALIRFVDDLVDARFEGEERDTVREEIGLEGGRFGFRMSADHRVFTLDSANVELWRLHEEGTIDLYAMAGLLSFDSFSVGSSHPNATVTSVGEDGTDNSWPVTRWTISNHLETQGEANRLRVYPMTHRVAVERMETASEKLDEIGVVLDWNDGPEFAGFRDETRQEITSAQYDFDAVANFESLLSRPEYNRPAGVNCNLLALAGFEFGNFGLTAGRTISEGANAANQCPTPGRTDECCVTVDWSESSGVIYRDIYPGYAFQYVLPHEIGHYLGLCHEGHDGFQNVMFRPSRNGLLDPGLLSFYWRSEPHFTLEDGKNAWRFIVDQFEHCLTGDPRPTGTRTATFPLASSPDSCAVEPERREAERPEVERRERRRVS